MANKTKRKSRYDIDAIGNPDYVPRQKFEQDAIDGALKPLDATARRLEQAYGMGRLQELVSPETAAKFQAAKAKLDVALEDNNVELILRRAKVLNAGWLAMEKEATEAGFEPAPPVIWHAHAPAEDGQPEIEFVIARDNSAATLAQTTLPVYTVEEIARVMRSWRSSFDAHAVKKVWPEAEVVRIDGDEVFDDEIPF